MIAGFRVLVLALPAALLSGAFACAGVKAAELGPERETGAIITELTGEVSEVATAAALVRAPAHWNAATRLQEAMANVELAFEELKSEDYEDLEDADANLLADLAAMVGKVRGGDVEAVSAVPEIQDRVAAMLRKRFDRPMPQIASASPNATFVNPGLGLPIAVKGQDFKQSFYEPVLVVRNEKGGEDWLAPKVNGDRELSYEVPAKYLKLAERQIVKLDAAVEFTIKTGGFFGYMQKEKTWRNRIVVLLLPSKFVTVAGTAYSAQRKQEVWRTSDEACHTNQGSAEAQTTHYECFTPAEGFEIDVSSNAYVVDRKLDVTGGRPAGGCEVATDAEHQASKARTCMACKPIADGPQQSATACGKLRWKEVEAAVRVTEIPLSRFTLDGRNPLRLVSLPADHNGKYHLQIIYFNGDVVETDGEFEDDWVTVSMQGQRNAVEVRMQQKVLFD